MTSALDPDRSSRRAFVLTAAALVAGGVGLGGCSAPGGPLSPQARRSADHPAGRRAAATPTATPIPVFPGVRRGLAVEDALVVQAALVLRVGAKKLGKDGRRLVTAIADQHAAHAAALRTIDPTDPNDTTPHPELAGAPSPTQSPSPSTKKPTFARSVDQLVATEQRAAKAHRAAALASTGGAALLWGSLATSAGALADVVTTADLAGEKPDPGATTVRSGQRRGPMPIVDVVRAEQELVTQLHAVVYGYQLALGRLSGSRRDTAAAELRRHRILRDQLTARLIGRRAEVPVARAAYVPSTNPRNAASAAKLIRQMETALVPFCGLWLAATDATGERAQALGQLGHTAAVARRWGAALTTWQGWRSA